MMHIEKIVWKELDWLPESPDQYPDGLPTPKPEAWTLPLDGSARWWDADRVLMVTALQMDQEVHLVFYERVNNGEERNEWDDDYQSPEAGLPGMPAGVGMLTAPSSWPAGDATGEDRIWAPSSCVSLPANRALDIVDALLYVHRRTHEHDYDGLVTEG